MIIVSMSVGYAVSNAADDRGRNLNKAFRNREDVSEIAFQSEFGS